MANDRILVVGSGAGGLAAAIDMARRGADVTVLERAAVVGGKMRHVSVSGTGIDAGPTVFTMRWIFESLFADAGERLSDHLDLTPAHILARHAWRQGGRLDLFADIDKSANAIAEFSGSKDAEGYRTFCARSADIYRTLVQPFIASERPTSPIDLAWRVGFGKLDALWRTAPMKSMWSAIGEHFEDLRLQQLFGRYATYCGSSPLLAPATLMLVAHVEQDGVWQVKGGMREVAQSLMKLAQAQGAKFRFESEVRHIIVERGRTKGVVMSSGERLDADAVVFNGDANAIGSGLLGSDASSAVPSTPRADRSLSAITWCIKGRSSGFPLVHHNVFFAENYKQEFESIFNKRKIPMTPTVYVCAQDRGDDAAATIEGDERLLVLINAPPDGDISAFSIDDISDYETRTFELLSACGLEIEKHSDASVVTTPGAFNDLFPATGGALYGRASHGSNATFQRPAAVSRIAGLYFAGGSVHPGPGVPMAAMSGRLTAARVIEDLTAHRESRRSVSVMTIPVPST
ncbi:MAG: CrtD protein [Hyphomicrobium sp.]|nr:MAG: CrtD protein [Hyphomicrobium sp.]PPD00381.1 MAG: CrtD protein [Hyphomicrobium sp.]